MGGLDSPSSLHLLPSPYNHRFNQNISHTCYCTAESPGASENRGTSLSPLTPVFTGRFLSPVKSYSQCVYVCKKIVVYVCM